MPGFHIPNLYSNKTKCIGLIRYFINAMEAVQMSQSVDWAWKLLTENATPSYGSIQLVEGTSGCFEW